jgi:hypothetical protein
LRDVATIVTPDTLLRWHRQLVVPRQYSARSPLEMRAFNSSERRTSRLARENYTPNDPTLADVEAGIPVWAALESDRSSFGEGGRAWRAASISFEVLPESPWVIGIQGDS